MSEQSYNRNNIIFQQILWSIIYYINHEVYEYLFPWKGLWDIEGFEPQTTIWWVGETKLYHWATVTETFLEKKYCNINLLPWGFLVAKALQQTEWHFILPGEQHKMWLVDVYEVGLSIDFRNGTGARTSRKKS